MAFVELEKARELLFELQNECIASNVKEDTTRGILYSINELEKLPTADVLKVVRCKDCKHKVDYCGRLMCGRLKYGFHDGVGGLVATVPEHFCSYGERKDA